MPTTNNWREPFIKWFNTAQSGTTYPNADQCADWFASHVLGGEGETIRQQLLDIMKENLAAIKRAKDTNMTNVLPSINRFHCIIETYEDLIMIINNLPLKGTVSKEMADRLNAPQPPLPASFDQRAKELYPYPENELYKEGDADLQDMIWVVDKVRAAYIEGLNKCMPLIEAVNDLADALAAFPTPDKQDEPKERPSTDYPEILIENPSLIAGKKPTDEDMLWARGKREEHDWIHTSARNPEQYASIEVKDKKEKIFTGGYYAENGKVQIDLPNGDVAGYDLEENFVHWRPLV